MRTEVAETTGENLFLKHLDLLRTHLKSKNIFNPLKNHENMIMHLFFYTSILL